MNLIFLGTAAGRPTKTRSLPCIALQYKGEVILFDCGEGVQRQMLSVVSPSKIEKIFISHFHGDHYLGLGGLLQTMSLNKRNNPLSIYGPKGSIHYLQNYFNSGHFGIRFNIAVYELEEDVIEEENYYIRSFPVEHGVPTIGFVFEEKEKRGHFLEEKARSLGIKGRLFSEIERKGVVEIDGKKITLEEVTGPKRPGKKIVYSADTVPCDAVVEAAAKCDILIHEGTYIVKEDRRNTYHTTVKEACEIAKKADVSKLILTHISQRYEEEEVIKEAEQCFDNVVVAHDLLEVTV
ncbi:MAG: ribonuclease Z [Candidatus Methanofastidiosia archaeon]|jgi:ribonuclease Z